MAMTETSLRQPLRYTIDLSAGLVQQPMRGQLMKGDKKANRVIVHLTDGGKDVTLSGVTVTGSFIRPPDAAEIPLKGEASGSEAIVTLDDACYATEGYCEIGVKLTVGETSRTILTLTGYVLSKGSGAYVDVSGVIPDIDDVIAQYAEMKRVTQETQAAGAAAGNAAGAANTAAGEANRQAQAAQQAAQAANTAAAKIDGMTVSAEKADAAGATISQKDGAYHVNFKLPKGDTGATPDITFEVETGPAGSDVQLEQSGTPEAPVVKLTIPRGDTGAVEGVDYYEGNPEALGTASPGTANGVARGDHVHPKPTPGDIGAASKEQLNQFSQQIVNYHSAIELVDNGDFSIAQAGYFVYDSVESKIVSGAHGTDGYVADRWKAEKPESTVFSRDGDVNTISAAVDSGINIMQIIGEDEFAKIVGKPVTIAIYDENDNVVCASGVVADGVDAGNVITTNAYRLNTHMYRGSRQLVRFTIFAGKTVKFKRIRVVPGAYTAETLPPYVPKPPSVELATCQLYYREYNGRVCTGHAYNANIVSLAMPILPPMRKAPSLTECHGKVLTNRYVDIVKDQVTNVSSSNIGFDVKAEDEFTPGEGAIFNGTIVLCADA